MPNTNRGSWIGSNGVPFQDIGMTQRKWDLLKEMAEGGGYWATAYQFVRGVTNRKLPSLSLRQRNWLTEIITSLGEELNSKPWR